MAGDNQVDAEAKAKAKQEADDKAKADAEAKEEAKCLDAEAKAKAKRKPFHVPGPGGVFFEGKLHKGGAELSLTEEEAEEMAELVKPGRKPAEPAPIGERKAGKYRVTALGQVLHSGVMHAKGKVLHLDEDDARSLGAYVEEA